jgi:hypothetical protein
MNNTVSAKVKLSTYVRWCGVAAILGGVLLILATVIFVFTHGTQSEAQHGTLFGFRSAQYAKFFQPPIWLSFLLGVIGVNAIQARRAKQLGKIGFITSALGYGLATFSWILQTWIVDPDRDFRSVFVQGGFSLWLLSILVQTVGMTLFGFALMRAKALPRWNGLPLLIGLLLLPTNLFLLFVFDRSNGSFVWNLIYISACVPYSLCWVLLGYSVCLHKPAA